MSDLLKEIQDWYQSQCNGDWELGDGIKIDSLDNPGWWVKIDLRKTVLENEPFATIDESPSETDWIICKVEEQQFDGAGDPQKLEKILSTFYSWAKLRS